MLAAHFLGRPSVGEIIHHELDDPDAGVLGQPRRISRRRAGTSRPPSPAPRPAFPPQAARGEAEIERAREVDKGHGRIETRSIEVTSSLAEYPGSDRPGCERVFRLTRVRETGEKVETEVVPGITSPPRERAGAGAPPGLIRGHWGIENGLHGPAMGRSARTPAGLARARGRR